jgi:type II secretion system protein N
MIGPAFLRRLFGKHLAWWLFAPLLLLIAALISFYWAFPSRTLKARLQMELAQNYGLQAQLSPPKLLFPLGLACSQFELTFAEPYNRTVPLRKVRVSPLWFSLLGDDPGLRFRASLNGGTLTGTSRSNGQTTLLADQVTIQETLQINGGPSIQGVLQNSHFRGLLPLQLPGERNLSLTLNQVRLSGLETYGVDGGSLDLGQLVLQAEGEGKTLRLKELSLKGGALEGSGQGTVMIGSSPAATRLNLTLELRPGNGLNPALGELLSLIGSSAPNGSRRLRLSGSLQQPALR